MVGKSSTPSTSKEFQPITEIALKTQDIIRLCVPFCSNAMKNTLNPDSTILTAVIRIHEIIFALHFEQFHLPFSSNIDSIYKSAKNPHER